MKQPHKGFVLVSVLWVLVIMVMAATAFSVWVDRVRDQAEKRQLQVEAYRTSIDALNKVVYTYMTGFKNSQGVAWPGKEGNSQHQLSFNSLDDFMAGAAPTVMSADAGFLKMDGAVFKLGEKIRVMVQDRAGLVGLSSLADMSVFSVVAGEHNASITGERLRDTLRDYQDPDGIRNLQGAELRDYQQQGMMTPADGYLRSPFQLRHIIGWNDVLVGYDDAWILQAFKTDGSSIINANTASSQALALVIRNPEMVSSILDYRQREHFDSVSKLSAYAGHDDEILLSVLPAGGFRFWWWYEGGATAYVYDVQFSPLESGLRAWYFNWSARVNLPDDLASKTAITVDHPFFH